MKRPKQHYRLIYAGNTRIGAVHHSCLGGWFATSYRRGETGGDASEILADARGNHLGFKTPAAAARAVREHYQPRLA